MRTSGFEGLRQPLPEATVQPILHWLDEAFDGDWSFRIASYEIRDAEVIVLGELSSAGMARQQFGQARKTQQDGSCDHLGEDLKKAAQDALAECASEFKRKIHSKNGSGRPHSGCGKNLQGKQSPSPLSSQQLSAIFSLAKFRGFDQKAVLALTRDCFGKAPRDLDTLQAAQMISDLVIQPEKSTS